MQGLRRPPGPWDATRWHAALKWPLRLARTAMGVRAPAAIQPRHSPSHEAVHDWGVGQADPPAPFWCCGGTGTAPDSCPHRMERHRTAAFVCGRHVSPVWGNPRRHSLDEGGGMHAGTFSTSHLCKTGYPASAVRLRVSSTDGNDTAATFRFAIRHLFAPLRCFSLKASSNSKSGGADSEIYASAARRTRARFETRQ